MLLNSGLSLAVVVLFAFAIHAIFDIKASLTPLISLIALVDVVMLFSLVGMLKPGVVISYGIAIAAFGFAVVKNKDNLKQKLDSFLSPGVILFIISCVLMLVFLAIRQPIMSEWDEFSFWGISKKLLFTRDRLYTYYSSSMLGQSTPPSLAVLSYFFQRFDTVFYEWVCFFSYDVLFFACYSAFTAAFEKKGWNTAFMVYLFSFLIPYIFEVYTRIIYLEPMYMSTYADVPLGLTFGGAVAVYFFSDKNDTRDIVPVLLMLIFLTGVKDMGFALACIVAFVLWFDMVVGRKEFSFVKIKGFWGKFATGVAMVATTFGMFILWTVHMAAVTSINRLETGGSAGMSMPQVVISGLTELLIGPRSEKFTTIMSSMIDAFFNWKVSMLGSGFVIVILITIIFAGGFIFGDKNGRKRSLMMYITSWIGFIGYYVFHLFMYVYIFGEEGYSLVSYNRYMYAYYIGWLVFALINLAMAVKDGKRFWAKGMTFGLAGAVFLVFSFYVSYDNIFVEFNERSFATRKNISRKVDYIQDAIGEDDVIYLYSGGDNGERWFIYTFELIDNYIMEDDGVDVFGLEEARAREKYRQTYFERFKQLGVTHIMIDHTSEFYENTFGDLFDWSVGHVGINAIAYYKINYTDTGFTCELVKGGEVTDG